MLSKTSISEESVEIVSLQHIEMKTVNHYEEEKDDRPCGT